MAWLSQLAQSSALPSICWLPVKKLHFLDEGHATKACDRTVPPRAGRACPPRRIPRRITSSRRLRASPASLFGGSATRSRRESFSAHPDNEERPRLSELIQSIDPVGRKTRIVAIDGHGGSGKSELARQLA